VEKIIIMKGFIEIEGSKIHYKLEGKGPQVIVLVHGFPESIENWNGFDSLFAKEYTTISIDLPGFGKSDMISEVHTMELFADVVHEVVKNITKEKILFVGHSMGGYIGLEYAKKYKDSITGLVLLNSHAKADSPEKKEGRLRQIEILKSGKKAPLMRELIPQMFAEENEKKYKDVIEKFIEIAINTKTEGIIAALLGMRLRNDNMQFVHKANLPILVLAGDKDRLIPIEVVNEHKTENNPNVTVEILENVGHASFIEAPTLAFETIKNLMLK
jgi:pimeloyl-ACP methyl ester carboxylesterase